MQNQKMWTIALISKNVFICFISPWPGHQSHRIHFEWIKPKLKSSLLSLCVSASHWTWACWRSSVIRCAGHSLRKLLTNSQKKCGIFRTVALIRWLNRLPFIKWTFFLFGAIGACVDLWDCVFLGQSLILVYKLLLTLKAPSSSTHATWPHIGKFVRKRNTCAMCTSEPSAIIRGKRSPKPCKEKSTRRAKLWAKNEKCEWQTEAQTQSVSSCNLLNSYTCGNDCRQRAICSI